MKAKSSELLKHAVDVMQMLKNGKVSTEDAKAHANLLKQSNNILRYELDRAVAIRKFDGLTIREIEE